MDYEQISTKDLLGTKSKNAYPKTIIDKINLISMSSDNKYNIVGSASYLVQKYYADIDVIEKIIGKNTNDTINGFIKKLKSVVKKIDSTDLIYFSDFKAGLDNRYNINIGILKNGIFTPSKDVDEKVKKLFNEKLLNLTEYTAITEALKSKTSLSYDIISETLRMRKIVRWTQDEITKGFKILPGKVKLELKKALTEDTTVKLDTIIVVNDNFLELTNVLLLGEKSGSKIKYYDSKANNEVANTIENLKEDVEKLYYSEMFYSPFKASKRLFSLIRLMINNRIGDEEDNLAYVEDILPLITEDTSLLYQQKSFLEACSRLAAIGVPLPDKTFRKQLDNIKFVLPTCKILSKAQVKIANGLIEKIQGAPKKEKKKYIDLLVTEFTRTINVYTDIYLKENDLIIVPKEYLPAQLKYVRSDNLIDDAEEGIIDEKEIEKLDKLLESGDKQEAKEAEKIVNKKIDSKDKELKKNEQIDKSKKYVDKVIDKNFGAEIRKIDKMAPKEVTKLSKDIKSSLDPIKKEVEKKFGESAASIFPSSSSYPSYIGTTSGRSRLDKTNTSIEILSDLIKNKLKKTTKAKEKKLEPEEKKSEPKEKKPEPEDDDLEFSKDDTETDEEEMIPDEEEVIPGPYEEMMPDEEIIPEEEPVMAPEVKEEDEEIMMPPEDEEEEDEEQEKSDRIQKEIKRAQEEMEPMQYLEYFEPEPVQIMEEADSSELRTNLEQQAKNEMEQRLALEYSKKQEDLRREQEALLRSKIAEQAAAVSRKQVARQKKEEMKRERAAFANEQQIFEEEQKKAKEEADRIEAIRLDNLKKEEEQKIKAQEIAILQKEIDERNAELATKLQEFEKQQEDYKAIILEFDNENKKLKKKQNEYNAKIKKQREDEDNAREKLKNREDEVKKLEEKVTTRNKNSAKIETDVNAKLKNLAVREKQLEENSKQNDIRMQQINQKEIELKTQQDKLSEEREKIIQLQAEINSLNEDGKKEFAEQIESLKRVNEKNILDMENLRKEQEELTIYKSTLETETAELTNKLNEYDNEKKKLEQELIQLRETIEQNNRDLEAKKLELNTQQQAFDATIKEISDELEKSKAIIIEDELQINELNKILKEKEELINKQLEEINQDKINIESVEALQEQIQEGKDTIIPDELSPVAEEEVLEPIEEVVEPVEEVVETKLVNPYDTDALIEFVENNRGKTTDEVIIIVIRCVYQDFINYLLSSTISKFGNTIDDVRTTFPGYTYVPDYPYITGTIENTKDQLIQTLIDVEKRTGIDTTLIRGDILTAYNYYILKLKESDKPIISSPPETIPEPLPEITVEPKPEKQYTITKKEPKETKKEPKETKKKPKETKKEPEETEKQPEEKQTTFGVAFNAVMKDTFKNKKDRESISNKYNNLKQKQKDSLVKIWERADDDNIKIRYQEGDFSLMEILNGTSRTGDGGQRSITSAIEKKIDAALDGYSFKSVEDPKFDLLLIAYLDYIIPEELPESDIVLYQTHVVTMINQFKKYLARKNKK